MADGQIIMGHGRAVRIPIDPTQPAESLASELPDIEGYGRALRRVCTVIEHAPDNERLTLPLRALMVEGAPYAATQDQPSAATGSVQWCGLKVHTTRSKVSDSNGSGPISATE